jgi:hypothetical protein
MVATLTPDTISSSVLPSYDRELRDNVLTSVSLLEWLFDTENVQEVNGGLYIATQIAYNPSPNANSYAGGMSQLPATFVGNTTTATFPPCYYFFSVAIPDTTLFLNRDDGEIIDLITAQYEWAKASLIDVIGADAYGDSTPRNGGPTLSGLAAINTYNADPGGGAYGGITRIGSTGTFKSNSGPAPFWNANVLTVNGGQQVGWSGTVNTGNQTILTVQAIQAMVSLASVGQYRPRAIVGDKICYNSYLNLTTATLRNNDLDGNGTQGFKTLDFAGLPLFQDDKCPTGTLYTLNDLLKLRPWKGAFFTTLPWRQPSNALVNIKYGLVIMNMVHTRPNTMAVMSGVTQ